MIQERVKKSDGPLHHGLTLRRQPFNLGGNQGYGRSCENSWHLSIHQLVSSFEEQARGRP